MSCYTDFSKLLRGVIRYISFIVALIFNSLFRMMSVVNHVLYSLVRFICILLLFTIKGILKHYV